MDIVFFGHDVSYSRLAYAISCEIPKEYRVVFYCNKPGLAWFSRSKLGLHTILVGRGRLSKRLMQSDTAPFDLDLRFYAPKTSTIPFWNSLTRWYYDQTSEALRDTNPVLFISPGEYRITEQVFGAVSQAQYSNTPLIFFEAGPGPYIYLDEQGVNANASFAHISTKASADYIEPISDVERVNRDMNDYLLSEKLTKAIDILWVLVIEIMSPVNEFTEYLAALRNRFTMRINKWISKKKKVNSAGLETGGHLLFVDQVRSDVNATHFGCTDSEVFRQISDLMDQNPSLKLIWRPHPFERRESLFRQISEKAPGRTFLSNTASFSEELKGASAVLTVNSNGGLDALLFGLPVLLLGSSYYQQQPGVMRSPKELSDAISSGNPTASHISNSAKLFIRDNFIPLDYRGQNFSNVDALTTNILTYIGLRGEEKH